VSVASSATEATPGAATEAAPQATAAAGWDCHVHLFDAQAPVIGAHYRPAHATLHSIEAVASAHGVGHLVLVQPSVYGQDNSLLLNALASSQGRHRGVVVTSSLPPDLAPWHALGVRGVRINRVSPVGRTVAQDALLPVLLKAWAPSLRAFGWHVQWYVSAEELPAVVQLQAQCGLPFVLDHLAGMHTAVPAQAAVWQALRALADTGAWVKLSGWYRLQAASPYRTLHSHIERVAQLFGDRLLWGSDWPHTSFNATQAPSYASQWQPVLDVLGAPRATVIRDDAPQRLYG
jgi:predicted TIM-barrel fold metal-dependent hydrolase